MHELEIESGWSFDDWSLMVPEKTVAALAMARTLREHGRSESDEVLRRILIDPGTDTLIGAELAMRHALMAEAYVLLGEWQHAEVKYRLAIEQIYDPTIKRMWWFNLAAIAAQANDDAQRTAALQSARETVCTDDISRRSYVYLNSSAHGKQLIPSGRKAN